MRSLERIRKALDRSQHAGHRLTPKQIETLYSPEATPAPRQVGASPLDRRIVTRPVQANGSGPHVRRRDRIEAALERAQHGGERLTPATLKPAARRPGETPLSRRLRERAAESPISRP